MLELFKVYIGLIFCSIISIFALLFLLFNKHFKKMRTWIADHKSLSVFIVFFSAVIGRYLGVMAFLGIYESSICDMDIFILWADMMRSDGFKGFLTEYPNGSLLMFTAFRGLLWITGLAKNFVAIPLVMKTPAIICDTLLGYVIFRWAKKHMPLSKALVLSSLILFSPAHVINSSMWGQIDGILAFFIVCSFYFLSEDKKIPAAILYAFACLAKAQAIFFAPVFGMYYILPFFKKGNFKKAAKDLAISAAVGIAIFSIFSIPFKISFSDIWLARYFKHLFNMSSQNTSGALNLLGLLGGNAISSSARFLFFNYKTWGTIFIILISISCIFFTAKSRNDKKHLLLAAYCMASIFMFTHGMHERYMLPVIAPLAAAFIFIDDKRILIACVLNSFMSAVNQAMMLLAWFNYSDVVFWVFAALNLLIYLYLLWVTLDNVYSLKNRLIRPRSKSVVAN